MKSDYTCGKCEENQCSEGYCVHTPTTCGDIQGVDYCDNYNKEGKCTSCGLGKLKNGKCEGYSFTDSNVFT